MSKKHLRLAERHPQPELPDSKLFELYELILRPRLIEEKMLLLLRQGRISKWFSGIGQEAIAVGSTAALLKTDYILPLHRNLGVFTTRAIPFPKLFAQWQGKKDGFTKGRDRSFHFGTIDYRIIGMISHLGPQLAVADGLALAAQLAGKNEIALAYSGDGGTSEGDFHEALNVAAVWDLPVIFLIENNGYGLSTPISEQFRCKQLSERAVGYGIEGVTIDGNDIVGVYQTVKHYADLIRKNPRPILIECMTFRMRGHEEASGVKYVPKELFEQWQKSDPVNTFEQRLLSRKLLSKTKIEQLRSQIIAQLDSELEDVFAQPEIIADSAEELADVYAPYEYKAVRASSEKRTTRRFVDAISDGLRQSLRRHPNLVVMGQDVAEYGGVFKITEGFLEEFGAARIRNTPLCESAIIGAGFGMSIAGFKSVIEMQFADFVTCGFNQIINNLAKSHYRWGQNADVVVRMPCGAGVAAGPFHSQSNEAWFAHTPGLKVVYPATPHDAKGLLTAAIEDPNPVIYFEHKALYRSLQAEIPEDYYTEEIGKARVARSGKAAAIITYGMGVHWALALAEKYDLYVLDLRTLLPLDYDAIAQAVEACSRVLVLHEDTLVGGFGAEIAAHVAEHHFMQLDAPVMRVASLDSPVPFAAPLEKNFLPAGRLQQAIEALLAF